MSLIRIARVRRNGLTIGVYGLGLAVVLGTAAAMPVEGRHMVVAASPFAEAGTAERIVAAAGGSLVAGTRVAFAAIAESEDPDFVDALYRAGAVLVLDAGRSAGCSGQQRE
jgi:hypothetical protein